MSVAYTLDGIQRHEERIRKSRFLAQVAPIHDMADALDFLDRVTDASAHHNCWACRIGQQYRFSDDGEPGGSAGKPILQAIDGQHMDGVVAVVTRWFGGIKLGVGGLIRAYRGTAAACIRQAAKKPIVVTTQVRFALAYPQLLLFKARTRGWPLHLDDEVYTASEVCMTATVAQTHLHALQQLLANISRGENRLQRIDKGNQNHP